MKTIEFKEYITKKIWEYDLTEQKIADAVGVSQKTINRYKNGEVKNVPEHMQKKIIEYFDSIKRGELKPGERYARKKDFDDYYDSYDKYEEGEVSCHSEMLSFYTPNVQDYVLKYFELFWSVKDEDVDFIRQLHLLDERPFQNIKAKMEGIPLSLELIMAGNLEEYEVDDVSYVLQKIYLLLRDIDKPVRNIHNKVNEKTGKPVELLRKDKKARFEEWCLDMYHQTGQWITKDFFTKLDELLNYTNLDWYMLFLLYRTRASDSNGIIRYVKTEGRIIGENENMIRQLMGFYLPENY